MGSFFLKLNNDVVFESGLGKGGSDSGNRCTRAML